MSTVGDFNDPSISAPPSEQPGYEEAGDRADRGYTPATASEADTFVQVVREAAQDHGAPRFIRNNADAGVLGACGEKAAAAALQYLRSRGGASIELIDHLLGELQ